MLKNLIPVVLILQLPSIVGAAAEQTEAMPLVGAFVRQHCLDCHAGDAAEAGLDLQQLSGDLVEPTNFDVWVKVHDRIQAGEMPPAEANQPEASSRRDMLASLSANLHQANAARQHEFGRVQLRRLNRTEYEYTVRDLLALPHLEVKGMLPADGTAHGFDTVAEALNLSSVQMARYLEAADAALDEAMQLGPRPATERRRFPALADGRFAQVVHKQREAVQIGEAVGLLRQPNSAQAPWTWRKINPPVAGMYRVRMKAFGITWNRGEVLPPDRPHVVSFYGFKGTTKRPLGTFDVPAADEPTAVIEFTAFLTPGDQLEIWFETLDDRNKPDAIPLDEYTAPGVAVEWLTTEGPLIEQWPPESYRRLFGDLPSAPWSPETGLVELPVPWVTVGNGKRAKLQRAKRNKITLYHVVSENPQADARRLLAEFAQRAWRRPVEEAEVEDYLALVDAKLRQKACFQEALRIGFQAVLCSPEFLFLQESPGRLDDDALASRLSYFLWKSSPDGELRQLAKEGKLQDPQVLREQVERMLGDARSERFVEDFAGQWLDLDQITVTQPDELLYPEFDRLLLNSMVEETHAYFRELLDRDLGAAHVVDSSFAMLNARLAELYGVVGVEGAAIRKVELPADSPRGGFLTQASILKVTANGTTTSPVTRGAWVLDRLLAQTVPPPPASVAAIEPDLRGTTTIREQLDKHRQDAACASCHRHLDPPGFALENFDVIGGWRDRYRSLENGDPSEATFKNNRPVRYALGRPVDASGQAPGGETFQDIHGLRRILLQREEQLARNLTEHLLVYGTGGGVEFADRKVVEQILHRARESEFGLRTLIHEVVQSETFRNK
ncbi:MAG: DUF1592 domain-containing protein [Pirellulaceae bacterium]